MHVNTEEKTLVLALILEFNCCMFLNNADFRELSAPYVWKIEGILKIPASWGGVMIPAVSPLYWSLF